MQEDRRGRDSRLLGGLCRQSACRLAEGALEKPWPERYGLVSTLEELAMPSIRALSAVFGADPENRFCTTLQGSTTWSKSVHGWQEAVIWLAFT